MTRAATTLAGPCTGAQRRDFLLGLRHGQLVGAHVPSWCSRHGWTLVAPDELARLASLQLVATRHLRRVQGGRPPTALVCQSGGVEHHSREASMGQVSTIGLDLAKSIFRVHGADASGAVVFRKRLRRSQVRPFLAAQPPCTVAMEACGSAHYWAREIGMLGHAVRLIPPAYVKPFVKRQKNNATDAEAICEAAQRPTMRFVAPKSEQAQAAALVFRARDLLVRQRTQVINALRGHLFEFGIVVAKGPAHVPQLVQAVENPDEPLPEIAPPVLQILIDTLHRLDEQIADLEREIVQRAKADETAHRLMTIPGIGPVTAVALTALAPPAQTFTRGRDFAAWVGLTPLQHSTGGKQKLGATSKMGERTLRRLLIIGASAVLRWAARPGAPAGSWIARMLACKPPMLVRVALANKMARIVWALMAQGGTYQAPAARAQGLAAVGPLGRRKVEGEG